MLRGSIFGGTLLLLMWILIPGTAAEQADDRVSLELPRGSAQAGREAFLALSCTSCHAVKGEKKFPEPVSASPGPTLGAYQARQSTARLGLSIVAPSHEISANVGQREDKLSPMGDFSEVMTVRQLLDLVEYIRSLDR